MANAELENVLSRCLSPEAGCFASEPGALGTMLYIDDLWLSSHYQRIANGADDAARLGLALEDASYVEAKMVQVGTFPTIEGRDGIISELRNGSALPMTEILEDESTASKIAKCAYACGKSALCPLKTPADS